MGIVLRKTLSLLTRWTLRRYRPVVVGITGSAGKTSAKEAIKVVLQAKYRVGATEKNYNTEIGVPLAVLRAAHGGRNPLRWLAVFLRALARLAIRDRSYPEILVLEMAADRPGDIACLVELAPPAIGVLTVIGDTPVHVEFFAGPEDLANEKAKLIEALPKGGYAVLNTDDAVIAGLRKRTAAEVLEFGFGAQAAVRITNYELRIFEHASGEPASGGVSFKLEHGGSVVPVRLDDSFGEQQAYAAAAAAAVGLACGLHLVEIAEALGRYTAPPGRLKLIRGERGTQILDDTYNASPVATAAALDVLERFPAQRRIAVLGDMLELGRFAEKAHRNAGERAAEVANIFIGVGECMRFAIDAALSREIAPERDFQVYWFANSRDAARKLEVVMQSGDVILVKGSQGIRMEQIVENIMAEPERAAELLVRQAAEWKNR